MCASQGYFILVTICHLHDHRPELLPDPVLLLLFVNKLPFKMSSLVNMGIILKVLDQVFQLYLMLTPCMTPSPSSSLPP